MALHASSNAAANLGMISGFTVLFAIALGIFSNARRAEIFGATAAYAAVLVVFVSGNLGTGPCSPSCLQNSAT